MAVTLNAAVAQYGLEKVLTGLKQGVTGLEQLGIDPQAATKAAKEYAANPGDMKAILTAQATIGSGNTANNVAVALQAPGASGAKRDFEQQKLLELGTKLAELDPKVDAAKIDLDKANEVKIIAERRLSEVQKLQKQKARDAQLPAAEAAVKQARLVVEDKQRAYGALTHERDAAVDRTVQELRGPQLAKLNQLRQPVATMAAAVGGDKRLISAQQAGIHGSIQNVATVTTSMESMFYGAEHVMRGALVAVRDAGTICPPAITMLNQLIEDYNADPVAEPKLRLLQPLETPVVDSWQETLNRAHVTQAEFNGEPSDKLRMLKQEMDSLLRSARDWEQKAQQPGVSPELAREYQKEAEKFRLKAAVNEGMIKVEEKLRLESQRHALQAVKNVVLGVLGKVQRALETAESDLGVMELSLNNRVADLNGKIDGLRNTIIKAAKEAYAASIN